MVPENINTHPKENIGNSKEEGDFKKLTKDFSCLLWTKTGISRRRVPRKKPPWEGMNIFWKNTITTKSTAWVYPSFHMMKCHEVLPILPDNLSSFRNTPSIITFKFILLFLLLGDARQCQIHHTVTRPGLEARMFSPVSTVHWVRCSAQCPLSKTLTIYVRPSCLPHGKRAYFYNVCLFF